MPDAPDQGQKDRPRAPAHPRGAPAHPRGAPGTPRHLLMLIGPGILVAATGVGAGDLATAAFAGSHLGLAVLWAVVVGALAKFVLNEQLARWQLATGTTILEGAVTRLGRVVWVAFGLYLFLWSPFVAVALMKACGAVLHALVPAIPTNAGAIGCSLAGLVMVWLGGFALFQRVMAACVALMFAVVVLSAALSDPDPVELLGGFIPRVPADTRALSWTIALMGGVGGTLTVIGYAYWMRQTQRAGPGALRLCRVDLALGYTMTALFGVGMVILASGVAPGGELAGGASNIIVAVADRVGEAAHGALRWVFLVGALGAVFSSVLGVWQVVPFIFADWWSMRDRRAKAQTGEPSGPYRAYLVALAVLPCGLLFVDFMAAQKLYGLVGAAFIPLLAIALAILMNRRAWVGRTLANGWCSNGALAAAIALSLVAAAWSVLGL